MRPSCAHQRPPLTSVQLPLAPAHPPPSAAEGTVAAASRALLTALARASPLTLVPLAPRLARLILVSGEAEHGEAGREERNRFLGTRGRLGGPRGRAGTEAASKGKKRAAAADDMDAFGLDFHSEEADGSFIGAGEGAPGSPLVVTEPLDCAGVELVVRLLAQASSHCDPR